MPELGPRNNRRQTAVCLLFKCAPLNAGGEQMRRMRTQPVNIACHYIPSFEWSAQIEVTRRNALTCKWEVTGRTLEPALQFMNGA